MLPTSVPQVCWVWFFVLTRLGANVDSAEFIISHVLHNVLGMHQASCPHNSKSQRNCTGNPALLGSLTRLPSLLVLLESEAKGEAAACCRCSRGGLVLFSIVGCLCAAESENKSAATSCGLVCRGLEQIR